MRQKIFQGSDLFVNIYPEIDKVVSICEIITIRESNNNVYVKKN